MNKNVNKLQNIKKKIIMIGTIHQNLSALVIVDDIIESICCNYISRVH